MDRFSLVKSFMYRVDAIDVDVLPQQVISTPDPVITEAHKSLAISFAYILRDHYKAKEAMTGLEIDPKDGHVGTMEFFFKQKAHSYDEALERRDRVTRFLNDVKHFAGEWDAVEIVPGLGGDMGALTYNLAPMVIVMKSFLEKHGIQDDYSYGYFYRAFHFLDRSEQLQMALN